MTTTKAEELSDWLFAFASGKAESIMLCRAAAELRRLSALCAEWEAKAATWLASPEAAQRLAGYRELGRKCAELEAERDDLKLALAHTVRLVQDWTQSAYAMEAERDALRADSERWRSLYARAINEANGLTNYVEDRPELRRAEKQLEAIQREARAIDAAMKGTK